MKKPTPSSVYGPVDSWRLGRSLGVDVLCVDSICSFECVYCQLGKINRVTNRREVFVSTDQILDDLRRADWQTADVITFSGSGEPTLAKNLGDVIKGIKEVTGKPVVVLTNSTLLGSEQVRSELALADKIFCKLDAWNDDVLRRVDRPYKGITLQSIVKGITRMRAEFKGFLAIQTMILRMPSKNEIKDLVRIIDEIGPDELQLNLPTRPIPREYFVETRGNEVAEDPGFTHLKTISKEQFDDLRRTLDSMTGISVVAR